MQKVDDCQNQAMPREKEIHLKNAKKNAPVGSNCLLGLPTRITRTRRIKYRFLGFYNHIKNGHICTQKLQQIEQNYQK